MIKEPVLIITNRLIQLLLEFIQSSFSDNKVQNLYTIRRKTKVTNKIRKFTTNLELHLANFFNFFESNSK